MDKQLEALRAYLRIAEVDTYWPPLAGHDDEMKVTLRGGVDAIAKRDDNGRGKEHEEAAFLVAEAMGWYDLVAPVVRREMNDQNENPIQVSLQAFWFNPTGEDCFDANIAPEEDVWRAAILDYLLAAGDHTHNFFLMPRDDPKKLRLFDYSQAFIGLSSCFFDLKKGQDIPPEHLEAVQALIDGLESGELVNLLTVAEFDGIKERAKLLLADGGLPEFP